MKFKDYALKANNALAKYEIKRTTILISFKPVYVVFVNRLRRIDYQEKVAVIRDANSWCDANIKHGFYCFDAYTWWFGDTNEAMLFKLTWV